jgi:hypothetical protein
MRKDFLCQEHQLLYLRTFFSEEVNNTNSQIFDILFRNRSNPKSTKKKIFAE